MRPKRILFCIPTLEGGGAERQLSYLCQPLIELGWDVHVALLRYGYNYQRVQNSGAKVHLIPHRSHYDPLIVWRLYRLIKGIQPAIIQTWILPMDILGGIASQLAHIPWVLSERNSSEAYDSTWKNRWRVRIAQKACVIVANSIGGYEYWQQQLSGHVTCQVIRNAVPLEEIERTNAINKSMLHLHSDTKVVLYAGRFDSHKNIKNFLLSLKEVLTRSNTAAILCGDGPLRPDMEELSHQLGIQDRVLLPGYVENLWAWIKMADVFVSVSLHEGMPNTVIEAMACRCPLLVSDIPQHREILMQSSALFVDPHQPDAIAGAILRVLQQPEEAFSRARCASLIASEWSIPAVAQQYANVYQAILDRK